MTPSTLGPPLTVGRPFRIVYGLTLAALALSGFGQMPIFGRYYVADLPGLGWLGAYYVTHSLHYLGAALLLGFCALALAEYRLLMRPRCRLSRYGWIQGGFMGGIVLTGVLRAITNYEGHELPGVAVALLDILHLGLAMGFLLAGLAGLAGGKKWTSAR